MQINFPSKQCEAKVDVVVIKEANKEVELALLLLVTSYSPVILIIQANLIKGAMLAQWMRSLRMQYRILLHWHLRPDGTIQVYRDERLLGR